MKTNKENNKTTIKERYRNWKMSKYPQINPLDTYNYDVDKEKTKFNAAILLFIMFILGTFYLDIMSIGNAIARQGDYESNVIPYIFSIIISLGCVLLPYAACYIFLEHRMSLDSNDNDKNVVSQNNSKKLSDSMILFYIALIGALVCFAISVWLRFSADLEYGGSEYVSTQLAATAIICAATLVGMFLSVCVRYMSVDIDKGKYARFSCSCISDDTNAFNTAYNNSKDNDNKKNEKNGLSLEAQKDQVVKELIDEFKNFDLIIQKLDLINDSKLVEVFSKNNTNNESLKNMEVQNV